jgi:hypothetical protein
MAQASHIFALKMEEEGDAQGTGKTPHPSFQILVWRLDAWSLDASSDEEVHAEGARPD